MTEKPETAPADAPKPKEYRTRAAVLTRTEQSALRFAVQNGAVVRLYQVRGGYEARALHMGPPRESHKELKTIDGPALRAAAAAEAQAAEGQPAQPAAPGQPEPQAGPAQAGQAQPSRQGGGQGRQQQAQGQRRG